MTVEEAINLCTSDFLSRSDVESLCNQLQISRPLALDTLAKDIAERYLADQVDFEIADTFMNSLWIYALELSEIPRFMQSVYEAFDAGEYYHREDPPGTDPERRYTRPQLEKLLSGNKTA